MKIYDYHGRANICGAKIKQLRQKKKISQEELAARMERICGILPQVTNQVQITAPAHYEESMRIFSELI